MALVVQKYGGSSLANSDSILRIARRIVADHRRGNRMVIVLSAMGDTTDHLLELAAQVSSNPPERELDMLLSVGERVSIAILAIAISELGEQAISFTGSQVGIITDNRHTEARILEVKGLRIPEALMDGKIVIVAGFQGVSIDKEITTLGRGGTDTTAIALAAALGADRCEIMKDVDGIFVAEPGVVKSSKLNASLSHEEMIEMANMGAGVFKTESVEMARHFKVDVAVGSSFTGNIGTIITDRSHESAAISGIIGRKDLVYGEATFPDQASVYGFLECLSADRIKTQGYSSVGCCLRFLAESRFAGRVRELQAAAIESSQLEAGMIGIVGTGLNLNSDTAARVFQAMTELSIAAEMMQITELSISWMMKRETVDEAVRGLHALLIESGE